VDLDGAVFELLVQGLLLLLFALFLVVVLLGEGVQLFVQALEFDLVLVEPLAVVFDLAEHALHLFALLSEVLLVGRDHLLLFD
jgi:hypothetical protein